MALITCLLVISQIILAIAEPIDEGKDVGTIQVENGKRIVLNPGSFPYIVHLHIEAEKIEENPRRVVEIHGFCGGTLITRKVVLSAAHCVKEKNNPKITAWLGVLETDLEQGEGQEVPVRGFTIHNRYTKSAHLLRNANDIALLFLLRLATLDGKTVRVAKLPTADFDAVGKRGWIVGWGRRSCGRRTTMLQQAFVKGISSTECQKYYKKTLIPSTIICIISEDRKTTSTQGDSGGPFVIDDTVVGVTSFGSIDWERTNKQNGLVACDSKKPAAYTYVPKYLDWIYQHLYEGPEEIIIQPQYVPTRPSSLPPKLPPQPSSLPPKVPPRPSSLPPKLPPRSSSPPPKLPPRSSTLPPLPPRSSTLPPPKLPPRSSSPQPPKVPPRSSSLPKAPPRRSKLSKQT